MTKLLHLTTRILLALIISLSAPVSASADNDPGQEVASADFDALREIRAQPKYVSSEMYTGPGTPEDGRELEAMVNAAIDDILAMPRPLKRKAVHARLEQVVGDVDHFDTADRDKTYTYLVLVWRAAGFQDNSGLFGVGDNRVLELDLDYQLSRQR